MDKDSVKNLKESPYFDEFAEHIGQTVDNFVSFEGFSGLSNERVGEIVRARADAILLVKLIFSPFVDFKEKHEPTQEEIDQVKEKFGL